MASIKINDNLYDNSKFDTALEFVESLPQEDFITKLMEDIESPKFYYDLAYGEEFDTEDPRFMRSDASGDDLEQEIAATLYKYLGLDGVYLLLEDAFDVTSKTKVNAKKQTTIKYKKTVIWDFLQHVRPQSREHVNHEILKITRQIGGGVYGMKERFSKLTLVGQWCIPYGKFDSVLNEYNVDFGAKFLSKFGIKLQETMKQNKYRVPIPASYANAKQKLDFDTKYLVVNSPYAGCEQLIGLTLQYGTNTLAQLVKYSLGVAKNANEQVDEFVMEYGQELEVRAPHKAQVGRTLYENLSEEQQRRIGYSKESTNEDVHVDYVPELMKRWMEYTGKSVTPVILEGKAASLGEFEDVDTFEDDDTLVGENESSDS